MAPPGLVEVAGAAPDEAEAVERGRLDVRERQLASDVERRAVQLGGALGIVAADERREAGGHRCVPPPQAVDGTDIARLADRLLGRLVSTQRLLLADELVERRHHTADVADGAEQLDRGDDLALRIRVLAGEPVGVAAHLGGEGAGPGVPGRFERALAVVEVDRGDVELTVECGQLGGGGPRQPDDRRVTRRVGDVERLGDQFERGVDPAGLDREERVPRDRESVRPRRRLARAGKRLSEPTVAFRRTATAPPEERQ